MNTVPIYRAYLPGQQPSAINETAPVSATAWETPDLAVCGQRDAVIEAGEGTSVLSPINSEPAECWYGCDDPECPYIHESAPIPIVSPPPQTIAAVVASTSRDAPAASPFPEMPKFLERRIA